MFDDPDDLVIVACVVAFVATVVITIDVVALYDAAVTFVKVAP